MSKKTRYFGAYTQHEEGNYEISCCLKAKNLADALVKLSKKKHMNKIKLGAMKTEMDERGELIVSEMSKKYYKWYKKQ